MPFYTVGHKENYEKAIAENAPKPILKTGKTDDYGGGIVFLTIGGAVAWLKNHNHVDDYAVWELDTDESNTYEGEGRHLYLINDAPIVPPAVRYT